MWIIILVKQLFFLSKFENLNYLAATYLPSFMLRKQYKQYETISFNTDKYIIHIIFLQTSRWENSFRNRNNIQVGNSNSQ